VAIVIAVMLTTSQATGKARAVQDKGHAPKLEHYNRNEAA
jgi:hypothetical protein